MPESRTLVDYRKVGDNSPQQVTNIFGLPKDVWIGIALGISIIVNVFLIFMYRELERET